jgi:glycosyl hydrolase family 99
MGIAGLVLAAAALQAGQAPPRHPQRLPDPVVDPVRVEIRVATEARTVRLRVLDDALLVADARREGGGPGARAAVEGDDLVLSGNADGTPAVATFRLVVSASAATLRLAAGVSAGRSAAVGVFNLNDEQRPARASDFTAVEGLELQTNMALLRTGGPLTAPRRDRLVLAHYYPWWDPVAWTDPQLLDQPLRLYSTDSAADVAGNLRDVAAAGIDAVIVSWQGSQVGGGWNLRRLRYILDAAQQAGLTVTVQLETLAANRVGVEGATPDPGVLTDWLVELIDTLATHPAWLKVDGRPVIFAYAWGFAGEATWRTVLDRLQAGGRQPLLMADSTDPAHLALAAGLATYSGTLFTPDVGRLMRDTVSASRTWHLLGGAYGAPRIATATVMPGYDETRLANRPGRVVARGTGEFYNGQWQAALASGADWVVVSTWNEWAENTEVEAGQRFGAFYVWRTRFWSAAFTGAPR